MWLYLCNYNPVTHTECRLCKDWILTFISANVLKKTKQTVNVLLLFRASLPIRTLHSARSHTDGIKPTGALRRGPRGPGNRTTNPVFGRRLLWSTASMLQRSTITSATSVFHFVCLMKRFISQTPQPSPRGRALMTSSPYSDLLTNCHQRTDDVLS